MTIGNEVPVKKDKIGKNKNFISTTTKIKETTQDFQESSFKNLQNLMLCSLTLCII
jgi:hypothetical protein